MKIFTILLSIIALALIIFNATKINMNAPFEGQSVIALITIFAALCAIILLQILRFSKRVEQKSKNRN
jgi:predicted tellurium resistance membrane protein TerC